MSDKIYEINGGFPPIKYCKKTKENKAHLFASTVNIQNILYRQNSNKLIDLTPNVEETIHTVDNI